MACIADNVHAGEPSWTPAVFTAVSNHSQHSTLVHYLLYSPYIIPGTYLLIHLPGETQRIRHGDE